MTASEAQLRAQAKYDKKNTKCFSLKFNVKNDADILERLEKIGNRQGYLKALIRADIERNK